ncbi:NUDIX domain-containing protein [Nonomuraea sp. NPDC049695]|uniref:NUDIX domain-containing protein n=1 Tax=Nonomuraea sp. NPDC049695 TaxID=3154734 RepID=UPI00341B696E
MGLDLNLVPDVVKPVAQPLAGGAIPDADVGGIIAEAETLEHLADLLAKIKTEDAHAVVRMLRGWEWQGPAKEAFEQAFAALGGEADAAGRPSAEALIDRLAQALREESASLRKHGVRMQQTEWMIYASLALLGVMIVRLLVWIYVNGPAVLRLIQHHTLLTQVKIETVKRLVLVNMVKFAAISGGLDFGVQVAQQIWGAREAGDFDLESLAMSLGSGALTGALFAGANAGLSRLLSRPMVYVASEAELAVRDRVVAITQSMYGQALLGGVAGTAGAVPGLALSGQLDAEHLAYTFISGVAGGLDIPASARVSFVPMRAVAEIGDPPLIHRADPPHAPDGPPPPAPRALEPHQPGRPGDHTPPATGHDATALVQHPRPEEHADADTSTDRDPSQPGDVLLQPYPSPVIMGEVTRRHDTPLPGPVGDRAGHGGTLARAPQGLPAERTPTGEAAPTSPPVSSRLTRGSMLPATVPAIISTTPDDVGTPDQDVQGTDDPPKAAEKRPAAPETADPASTAHSRPERPEQSPADDPAADPANHPANDPAPHPPRERGTMPETRTSTLSEMLQDQALTGRAPEPAVGPAAARPVPGHTSHISNTSHTGHGDRPDDAVPVNPIPDATPPARPHSSEQGEPHAPDAWRTSLQGDPGVPAARTGALPEDPRRIEPVTRRVADLLSRDGQYEPISGAAWEAADATAVKTLMDTMESSTRDMLGVGRKQNLQQAVGDPDSYLVLSEIKVVGRTVRTWHAVKRDSLPSFVEGSLKFSNERRRIIRQLPFDSPEALHIARRLAVEELLRTWGYGTSEMVPDRLAMHMAARDEFGLTGILDLEMYGDPSRSKTARAVHARSGDMLRDFLRQQYAETQRELGRRGIEELVLYRGMAFDPLHPVPALADAANGDVVPAPPSLPLQPWSAMPGVAKRYTGLGHGAVMAGVIPASQVLSTPWTGMGQLPLNEFVVLATPGEVTVLRPPHVSAPDPTMSDIPPGWRVSKPGDGWTHCEQGHRHWGTEGGAGLLAFHRVPGGEVHVLMQLRSMETHHGGTWGLPGGARHSGEDPVEAGLREAGEENRLDPREVNVRGVHHDDHGGWAFDTVIGEMSHLADVWPASHESLDNAWVPLEEVPRLNLHPDLARSWPGVRAELERVLADSGTGGSRPSAPDPTPPAPVVSPARTPPAPAARPWGSPPDIPGEFSPIADPRPRNFAEAAATVHRWTPGNERRAATDEELLAEGRRLADQLPVLDHGDTTARALASMSRILQWHEPRRALPEIAAELGLDRDVDALVDLYGDARRHGLAPDSATDRAGLTDILKRSMEADPHRWAGQRHHTLFSLHDVTAAQARTVGLMVHMMREPVTYRSARDFVRPVLERHGIRDIAQLLPVVRAAHENGYLTAGPAGETAFHAGMDRFRQEDPYLWDGVLLAERHSLTDPGDETARLVALLDEHAPPAGAGADRAVPPLERLAGEVGQGRSVEQLVRLAEDAQAHGADLTRATAPHELTGLLNAHRARDPHLWDGLRIAAERGITHPGDDDARALSRLAEITGAEAPSRLWVFDPLRRLAGEAGLDHSVERLAQRAAEAHRAGFDLFGPVDRWQVIDALTRNAPIGRSPDTPDVPPGLHDLSPSTVRDARQAAIHEHAEAQQAYQQAHPRMRRALSRFAGTDALAVAEQERVASLEARAQAWQRRPELPEVSFTRDFAAFRRAYDRALERAARGEPVIPYMTENATASLGARDGGRGFGLELEFDLPGPAAGRVLEDIARALHEAGLTGDAQVHSYHAMQGQGYRSGKNGGRGLWRLEKDGTVAGELVSPILYDEPATWENLRIACEIIRAHGGTATVSTGGHVHVSTHDYDHIVEHHTGVLDYVDHHSDTLYRLGHNPERESHRGLQYCQPNQRPAAGYEPMGPMRNSNSNRKVAVNMAGMKGSSKDHIEFRLWDGSLDPAVIQSQTKVSIALVEAVLRNAPLGDLPNMGRRDRLGTHAGLRNLGAALDLTERGSLSFRSLVDELFWRAADKEQLTALYAATRWVRAA